MVANGLEGRVFAYCDSVHYSALTHYFSNWGAWKFYQSLNCFHHKLFPPAIGYRTRYYATLRRCCTNHTHTQQIANCATGWMWNLVFVPHNVTTNLPLLIVRFGVRWLLEENRLLTIRGIKTWHLWGWRGICMIVVIGYFVNFFRPYWMSEPRWVWICDRCKLCTHTNLGPNFVELTVTTFATFTLSYTCAAIPCGPKRFPRASPRKPGYSCSPWSCPSFLAPGRKTGATINRRRYEVALAGAEERETVRAGTGFTTGHSAKCRMFLSN